MTGVEIINTKTITFMFLLLCVQLCLIMLHHLDLRWLDQVVIDLVLRALIASVINRLRWNDILVETRVWAHHLSFLVEIYLITMGRSRHHLQTIVIDIMVGVSNQDLIEDCCACTYIARLGKHLSMESFCDL